MDKTAIKHFATTARIKLISAVKQRAYELGITESEIAEPIVYEDGFSINGEIFRKEEIDQRKLLLQKLQQTSYEEILEEVAYTWFNRFIAIRFMEVNDYLPTGIRLLSSIEEGKSEPDALTEVNFLIDELNLNQDYVYELEDSHDHDQLFKYIMIKQCNQLGDMMPLVFEEITGYTALLLPDYLLTENSVLTDLVEMITEENWQDVEIIGWLYQYYNADKKDEVFAKLRKNVKISKQNIPAATQLFTPRWIVQYMVDNSLGRLWMESHDNEQLKDKLPYYLDEANQPEEVVQKLSEITEKNINPEDIAFLDPSMGSAHVLIYAFDVFYEIYLSQGFRSQDIPALILENNLYGLEIDDRATQLAYFALMMKAREYNHRIFQSPVRLNICAIQDSTVITDEDIQLFTDGDEALLNETTTLIETFQDGKLLGSIIEVPDLDIDLLEKRITEIKQRDESDLFMNQFQKFTLPIIESLVKQAVLLQKKYDIVVTNPPYMGRRGMNAELAKYVRKHYKDSSADMFAVFMEVASSFTENHGYIGMINQHAWMFLSSYEKLRRKTLNNHQIYSMAHLGTRAFAEIGGEVVQTTSFILRKKTIENYVGTFVRLTEVDNAEKKAEELLNENLYFYRGQDGFTDIPGSPIAYWASENTLNIYKQNKTLKDYIKIGQGLKTGDNKRFVLNWFEVKNCDISFNTLNRINTLEINEKWFPYTNGGEFRKWYGNLINIVNWQYDGKEIRNFKDKNGKLRSRLQNMDTYFKQGATWSAITSNQLSVRFVPNGIIYGGAGYNLSSDNNISYYIGLLNSCSLTPLIKCLSETLNFEVGVLSRIPVIKYSSTVKTDDSFSEDIKTLVNKNISLSKSDWDAFETSWDFEKHPFLQYRNQASTIEEAFNNWSAHAEERFYTLKENEEKLNKIFIDLYGLQDELTPDIDEKDVTVRKADRERDVKSYLSYLVGVMFGRYSLDESGLIFAGGEFDQTRYKSFTPDEENIIPITDTQYFEDDIVTRVITLTNLIFGETNLEDNLAFIADTLTRRRNETSRERIRRYFLREFHRDHVQMYQKRPIYWQVDSGGRNDSFRALIYLHRYKPDVLSRVRTQYLHPQMRKYEEEMNRLQMTIESDVSQGEKTRAKKAQDKIEKQIIDCQNYDQVLAHMAHQLIDIDLDDGVRVNYEKFQAIDVPQGEGKRAKKANIFRPL